MPGTVEEYLLKRIKEEGAIHITLIDPEDVVPKSAAFLARQSEACGSSAIMVGGTTVASPKHLDAVVKAVKKSVKIPVILFPNNITGVSEYADAIWFMSLLNSADPYFISGAQVLAAPTIKRLGLEAIPLGYIIVGEGGSVGVIGRACPISHDKPELAVAFSLAAQYFGMRFVYLEGGSGVSHPVPAEMVKMVRGIVETTLIVGGGIRTGAQAEEIVKAGADIIVTSTVLQKSAERSVEDKINEIVSGIRIGAGARCGR